MVTRLWVPALLSLALLAMVAPSVDSAAIGLAARRPSAAEAGPAVGRGHRGLCRRAPAGRTRAARRRRCASAC